MSSLVSLAVQSEGVGNSTPKFRPQSLYWCLTPGRWKRGVELEEVQNLAKQSGKVGLVPHTIYQLILVANVSKEEKEQLLTCYYVTSNGGMGVCEDCNEEDLALIESKVIGWITHQHWNKRKSVY